MMQQQRIDIVQERAARFGRQHGIGLEFLRQLYAVIIDETCRVEDRLISGSAAGEASTHGARART
jgi:chorismate mutase